MVMLTLFDQLRRPVGDEIIHCMFFIIILGFHTTLNECDKNFSADKVEIILCITR